MNKSRDTIISIIVFIAAAWAWSYWAGVHDREAAEKARTAAEATVTIDTSDIILPHANYYPDTYSQGSYSPTYHTDSNYQYNYRTGSSGSYNYNYDAEGYSDSGDYVTGNIDTSGRYGDGYLYDEDGNEIHVDTEWDGYGDLEATDDDGNTYDLEVN